MSVANFLTNNNKSYQNINCNDLNCNDLNARNLEITDLSCNDISCNNLTADQGIISLNTNQLNDISTNSLKFNVALNSLNFYDRISVTPSWTCRAGAPATPVDGVYLERIGNIVLIRITGFTTTGAVGTPAAYIVSQTDILPVNYRPAQNAQVAGFCSLNEIAVKKQGNVQIFASGNEIRIYQDITQSDLTVSVDYSISLTFVGMYSVN